MTASRGERLGAALLAVAIALPVALPDPASAQGMIYGRRGIEVDQLDTIDPESVGVLTEAPASLGIDLWQGSDRTQIVGLVRDLPRRIESPTLHAVTRRLLLTAARAPASGISPVHTLTAARVSTLIAIGATADAAALLGAAGARSRGEAIARIELDALLLAGQTRQACEAAAAGAGRYTTPAWQYAVAYCRALEKDADGARLAVDLVRDSGSVDSDPLYGVLVEAVLGAKPANLKFTTTPSPLQLAMLGAAKLPMPREAMAPDRPDLLGAIARMPDVPIASRLEAAEGAVALNAYDAASLAELYAKSELPAGNAWSPAARAAAWRRVATQNDPAARAKALKDLLENARRRGGWRPVASAARTLSDALRPDPAALPLAEEAMRVLLLSGRTAEALDWYALTTRSTGKEVAAAQVRLWPLLRLASGDGRLGWSDATLDAWARSNTAANGKPVPERAVLLYSLLAAVGDPVSSTAWADLPRPAATGRVAEALAALRGPAVSRGESLLHAITILDETGASQADPEAIRAAFDALDRSGLRNEARSIAVEIALTAGL